MVSGSWFIGNVAMILMPKGSKWPRKIVGINHGNPPCILHCENEKVIKKGMQKGGKSINMQLKNKGFVLTKKVSLISLCKEKPLNLKWISRRL